MKSERRPSGRWTWVAMGFLMAALGSLFVPGTYASALTVISQTLQNTGTDGELTETADWSGAAAVTRHESSDLTLNGSNQVTSVTVQGTKASGAATANVTLKDSANATLNSGSAALPSAAGTYSTSVTVIATAYHEVATVSASYSGPTTVALNLTDGWDNKNQGTLAALGTLPRVQTSDNQWLEIDTPFWTSFQFEQTIPTGATIQTVKVFVEHYEDSGYKQNDLTWKIGVGTRSSRTIFQTNLPTVLLQESGEATVSWDVTTWIDTPAKANDLKFVVDNGSSNGKKTNQDYLYVEVTYNP